MTTLNRLLIRDRLNLLVLLPLSVVLLMTVPFVADRVQDARQATSTASLVSTARQLGGLIQELERERLFGVAYLAAPDSRRNPLVTQAQTVNDEAAEVRASLQGGSPELQRALTGLSSLNGLRDRVLRRTVTANQVNNGYQASIVSLIDALGLSQGVAAGSTGARQQTALDALLRADEENSSVGAGLLAIVAQPDSGRGTLTTIGASARLEQLEARRFAQLAEPDQVSLFRTADTGLASQRVQRLRARLQQDPELREVPTEDRVALAGEVLGAVETEAGLRRLVQDKIARDVTGQAQATAAKARLAGLGFAGLAITLLILVVLLSMAIGRSIARPLRRLTVAAAQVADLAQSELIRVTDEEGDDRQPVQLAAVDVTAEDEIGDLAAALNRVQATAALLLERQVASRRNIASMFGSVGRRTQNLVGRQLAMIDALERNEQDLELLQRLYRLDHLSARLRRHADSLVVLSGTAEPMLVSTPLPMGDVIRSALGEIEDFQRVRIVDVADVRMAPDATRDLKLLIAELLENATSFSPPFTDVEVLAEVSPDGCEIEIVDHGVGMSAERLAEENARLISRERLDITPSDVLGLFVVGRLCRRHGIEVELEPTSGGGITARVTIPPAHLVTASGAGEQAGRASRPGGPQPAGGQRPGPGGRQAPRGRQGRPLAATGTDGPPDDGPPGRPPRREVVTRPGFPSDQRSGRQLSLAEESGTDSPEQGSDAGTAARAEAPGGPATAGEPAERTPPGKHGTPSAAPGPRGLRQRVRGAQLPDTGEHPAPGRMEPPRSSPEAARDLVEQFEAGTLRALRGEPAARPDTGADTGYAGGDRGDDDRYQEAGYGGSRYSEATGYDGGSVVDGYGDASVPADDDRWAGSYPNGTGYFTGHPANGVEEPAHDPHAAAVRSFALEIDRELRRTLESLTEGGGSGQDSPNSDFHWLDAPASRASHRTRAESSEPPVGLTRRVPGAQMPVTGPMREPDQQAPVLLDADAARAAVEAFEDGVARAMEASAEEPADGDGDRGDQRRTQEGDDG